jgi:hypothetical protein
LNFMNIYGFIDEYDISIQTHNKYVIVDLIRDYKLLYMISLFGTKLFSKIDRIVNPFVLRLIL